MNLRDYCLDGNLVKSCPSLIHHQPSSTRFNKIAIQATAQMAADKEAVGLSRVHMYESKCMLPLRDNSKEMVVGLRKGMLQQSSSLLRPVPSVQSWMVFIHTFFRPSSSSIPFYFLGDAVECGEVAIRQDLPYLYSLQHKLLGTCHVIDGLPHI